MADNKAHYGLIGFTLLLGIAAVAAVLIYVGGVGRQGHAIEAETYFFNPVSGLAPGAEVCFRGVKVGKVTRISFIGCEYTDIVPEHGTAIWVGLAMDPDICNIDRHNPHPEDTFRKLVEKGVHATLAVNLLTGIAHIELNIPKTEVREMPRSWKPRSISIPPAPTLLESATDTLPVLLKKIEKLEFSKGWSNVMETVTSASTLMNTFNTVVDSQQGNVAEVMDNLRSTLSTLRDFADEIKSNPSLLVRSPDVTPLPETAN